MTARVIVVAGPALCGKTTLLLAEHRAQLAKQEPGGALWLAPTQRGSLAVRGRLLGERLPGCFAPGVMTFDQFAAAVIQASQDEVRSLSRGMKRSLVRELIRSRHAAGKLAHFAPIAEKPGFVDLVCQWISELKRVEIWPEDFQAACQQRGMTKKDSELLALYREYQEHLTRSRLYDSEGRFWSARSLMTQGQRRPFESLRQVVVDGFTDFTRTQHEMLQELAKRVERLWISLPLEEEAGRAELFAKCNRTLAQLQERHPRLTVERLPRPGMPAWPALAHLEQELFKNPRDTRRSSDAAGLAILGTPGQTGEMEHLARLIKKLLTSGSKESGQRPVPPGEIAVIFRSLTTVAPLAVEIFERFGVPAAIEAGESLDTSTALAAFLALLRLEAEDWPFRRLLSVLNNNYFQPLPRASQAFAAKAAEEIVRHWQLPHGKRQLLEKTALLASAQATVAAEPATPQELDVVKFAARATAALPLLDRLEAALARLPAEATPRGWADHLTTLAEELGFLKAIDKDSPPGMPARDRLAWNRLLEELVGEERLAGWLERPAPRLTREALLSMLDEIVRNEEIPSRHEEVGRVRILAAASARALSIPYLFFAGLSEKAMPAVEREGRLYGEQEAAELHRRGLPLVLRDQRQQDEMLLFYEVVTRATKFLHLSYPALDDRAQPLLPSPYVSEVLGAFEEGRLERRVTPDLSPLPADPQPLNGTDWRLLAVNRSLAGQAELMASLRRSPTTLKLGANLLAGLAAMNARARRDDFGAFEGLCEGEAMRAELLKRFGAERQWSASELETYASCPYKFFAAKVLHLEEREDVALRVDERARGANLHATLAILHRNLNEAGGGPFSPASLPEEQFSQGFDAVLAAVLRPAERDAGLEAALCEIDRRVLRQWAGKYRRQHADYDAKFQSFDMPLRPAHFETAFGKQNARADAAVDPLSRPEPLVLEFDGEQVLLAGRIDRIDVGQAGGREVFSVVDYKSGGKASKRDRETVDGLHLQLDLYAQAVEDLLLKDRNAAALQTGYWRLKKKGHEPWFEHAAVAAGALTTTELAGRRRSEVIAKVFEIVRGIRLGQFPVFSQVENCTSYCEFKTVCRINQVRSLEKTWAAE